MTDYGNYDDGIDPEDLDDEEEQKKKKKKRGEIDSQAMGHAQPSENFYLYMLNIGASKGLIAKVLQNWRHLKGEGLLRALAAFASRFANSRASAHVEVEIDKNKDFGLIQNLIQFLKSSDRSLSQKKSLDSGKQGPR